MRRDHTVHSAEFFQLMSFDLQEAQRASIVKMLELKTALDTSQTSGSHAVPQWKVLVYDKACQDVIAPIMKVGQLRNHGVTLHLQLNSAREKVPDVPVIYFVEPTEENINRIVADLKSGLYSLMHINFSSSISNRLLERFGKEVSSIPPTSSQISRVVDRYCSFVSLSQTMYSLNMKSTYLNLHKTGVPDTYVESLVDSVSLSLMSVLLTSIKQVPVIRAPQNNAAAMVAERLSERLSDFLKTSSGRDMLSSSTSISSDPSHAQRPLLIVLDRDMDLTPMVAHSWSYEGLLSDLKGMSLNKVTADNKHYDIEVSDPFWKKIAHLPFPEAATEINLHFDDFNKRRQSVTSTDTNLSTMSVLPQITEMKKLVDMHTALASSLLNDIKTRGIDKFYEVETTSNVAMFLNELMDHPGLLASDKIRTAILLILKTITPKQLDQLERKMGQIEDPLLGAFKYVKYIQSLRAPAAPVLAPQTSNPTSFPGVFGGLAEKVKSHSETLIAQGMKNLKNMLPINDNMMFTNIVQQLADQVVNPLTESFSYQDPKNPGSSVRVRGSFRQIIICVVGGGSVSEFENLSVEWGAKTGRTVIYGATDFPNQNQFLADLAALGK